MAAICERVSTFGRMPSSRTPVSAPNRRPRPPFRLIPPITPRRTREDHVLALARTTEAIRPVSIRPASAASSAADDVELQTTVSTRMPAARAASALPPIA